MDYACTICNYIMCALRASLPGLSPRGSVASSQLPGMRGSTTVQDHLDGIPGAPKNISFDGFRFKDLGELYCVLDSATVAKYTEVDLLARLDGDYGNQKVEATVCSNVVDVLRDRMDFARFQGRPGDFRCEIDFEAVRPPPEVVRCPADGQEFRDAEDFFRRHHNARRLRDPSLPIRSIVLPYGLWSDGVQMSKWSGAGVHPVCLYIMSFRESIRFTHDNIVRLGYIPNMVHPRHVSAAGHGSHKWSKAKWHQVSLIWFFCTLARQCVVPGWQVRDGGLLNNWLRIDNGHIESNGGLGCGCLFVILVFCHGWRGLDGGVLLCVNMLNKCCPLRSRYAKQVELDLFHEALGVMLDELKSLEENGFLYNFGTEENPDNVTVYPFPLRYTVDYPECMAVLGLAMSGGYYPHPNYMVPSYSATNDVELGMGLDCPDIATRYKFRNEVDHMAAVASGS